VPAGVRVRGARGAALAASTTNPFSRACCWRNQSTVR
jgi:hypothetical protein